MSNNFIEMVVFGDIWEAGGAFFFTPMTLCMILHTLTFAAGFVNGEFILGFGHFLARLTSKELLLWQEDDERK